MFEVFVTLLLMAMICSVPMSVSGVVVFAPLRGGGR